jgi:hypothetical protein
LVGGGTRRRDLPAEDGYAPSDEKFARFTSDFSSSFAEKYGPSERENDGILSTSEAIRT